MKKQKNYWNEMMKNKRKNKKIIEMKWWKTNGKTQKWLKWNDEKQTKKHKNDLNEMRKNKRKNIKMIEMKWGKTNEET